MGLARYPVTYGSAVCPDCGSLLVLFDVPGAVVNDGYYACSLCGLGQPRCVHGTTIDMVCLSCARERNVG